MSSPRLKATKVQYTLSEYQLLIQFVKQNLRNILSLISSETQPPENINLTPSDLNALRIMFKLVKSDGTPIKASNFVSTAPFFMSSSPATKVKLGIVADWILSVLATKEEKTEDSAMEMAGLCKAVTEYNTDISGKDLKIVNCEDCYLYINSAVNNVLISNCTNCTIMVAAVSKICTLDRCEKISISVASSAIRVGNCVDCKLSLYTIVNPILYGDNRSILLAPHNVAYDDLMTHVKKSKLLVSTSNLQNWATPFLLKSEKDSFSIQDPKDFSKLELPANFKENMHMLAPANYLEILNERATAMNELMKLIKDAKLTPEQQAQLHNAVQGYFREWVVTSNNVKPIEGLVKMIDESGFDNDDL